MGLGFGFGFGFGFGLGLGGMCLYHECAEEAHRTNLAICTPVMHGACGAGEGVTRVCGRGVEGAWKGCGGDETEGGRGCAHHSQQSPVPDPIAGEYTESEPSAAAKPGRRVRPRRARVALREGAPQERGPQLLRGKGSILAVETPHVGAAVDEARARLRRKHLGDDQQDLAWQDEWDGKPCRRRGLECRPHTAPARCRAVVEGADHHRVVHHAYRHRNELDTKRKTMCCANTRACEAVYDPAIWCGLLGKWRAPRLHPWGVGAMQPPCSTSITGPLLCRGDGRY